MHHSRVKTSLRCEAVPEVDGTKSLGLSVGPVFVALDLEQVGHTQGRDGFGDLGIGGPPASKKPSSESGF